MNKSGTIYYRGYDVRYAVLGLDKNYSAESKIIFNINQQAIIKSIKLKQKHRTIENAEHEIIKKSMRLINQFVGNFYVWE